MYIYIIALHEFYQTAILKLQNNLTLDTQSPTLKYY